jgi:succinoglycan biosynthesis transport protein ExoP
MNDPYANDDRLAEAPPSPGMNLGDVYYVFFRHKWMIAVIFVLGVAGAAAFYLLKPAVYVSEAKILIKYILETKAPTRAIDNTQVKSLDSRADGIIGAEVEILTSYDLAAQVVEAIGAEKILAKVPGADPAMNAAAFIRDNFRVEAPKSSSVLILTFRHPDPELVRPILAQIIETYRKRHDDLHRGPGVRDSFLINQADQLRLRLAKTDEDLRKLKEEAKVISLEDDKRAYIERLSSIRTQLMSAEADLAQQRAVVEARQRAPKAPAPDQPANTPPPVTPEQAAEYLRVSSYVEALRKNLEQLRQTYTDEHYIVKTQLQRLSDAEADKKKLEAAHPGLGSATPAAVAASAANVINASNHVARIENELQVITQLEAKVKVLNEQFKQLGDEAARIAEIEPKMLELERNKKVDEENYSAAKSALDRTKIDESSGAGQVTGLAPMQSPTPPSRELGNIKKPILIFLAFGCFGGFGLAFVWEKILNRSIKRVADVERALDVPLFISVPHAGRMGGKRRRWWQRKARPMPGAAAGTADATVTHIATDANGELEILPWDPKHTLRPYFEGLRDRLITYFEVRKMTHKPKLVAVTSCSRGAGVSTMAAGLAATLSETGDGNVLLVDMNIERGAVHPFHQGLPGCALSEALEHTTREPAQIQDNLYVVSAHEGNSSNSSKLPTVLPKRFAHLIPKMKASDYDYIIFDMPPVSQTSVTARLSGFMDMMLMVIESEKTGQEVVQRASGLLNESRANVAAVLNKHRNYVPPALNQEL